MERALADAQAELGVVPEAAARAIQREAVLDTVDFERLRTQTRVVGYPILPLLDQVAESSPDIARHLHWGATTQDVMDTGLVLQMRNALARVESLTIDLGDALAEKALGHRSTLIAGRTHAQHAVPTTFGAKVAVWLAEVQRHLDRLRATRERVLVVQLFGAAGTAAAYGLHSRAIRHGVARRLGLAADDVPWHTARDSIAELAFVLAAATATCGKIGREVIELSRTEVAEVREISGQFRGASSTMPQKANPIDSEAVVGMAVLAAQQVPAMLVAMQGTHERAAGEWQVEWDALPTVFALAAGALAGSVRIVEGVQIFPERMRQNLELDGGMIMAEAVMMAAAESLGRQEAHRLVYEACARARADGMRLVDTLREFLGAELLESLARRGALAPENYLGEAQRAVEVAVDRWNQART